MQEQLSDIEIVKIETFCADEVMFEAVRKVLLAGLYTHGVLVADKKPNPLVNGAFSLVALSMNNPIPDEQIGQQLKAQWAGLNALENAVKELKNIKSKREEITPEINEAE